MAKQHFKTVTYKDVVYLRREDVISMLLLLASGEETDVRDRLTRAAQAVLSMSAGDEDE
jgi:uncharacterized membrane protein YdbT with pleckstrin-like domain